MSNVADRPLSLATHLRAAVNLLLDEANTEYRWDNYTQCNCGLLARCAGGYNKERNAETRFILAERKGSGWWYHFIDSRDLVDGLR